MAIKVADHTLVHELKNELRDADGKWFNDSDAFYKRMILRHSAVLPSEHLFKKVATGSGNVYYLPAAQPLYLWDPAFTIESGITYSFNATGSIEVLTGTPTEAQLTITGLLVDFDEAIIEACRTLLQHRSQDDAATLGSGSLAQADIDRLIRVMEIRRGAFAC